MNIDNDITTIKGVGPKTGKILNSCGIYNIYDLLLYFPRNYRTVKYVHAINTTCDGEEIIIKGILVKFQGDMRKGQKLCISTAQFMCGEKIINVKWFNMPYVKNNLEFNEEYFLQGKVNIYKGTVYIINPTVKKDESYDKDIIIPVYPLKENLKNNFICKIIKPIISNIKIKENLSDRIIEKYNLVSLNEAINKIHIPSCEEDVICAQKRLKFQEMLAYFVKLELIKNVLLENKNGIAFKISKDLKKLKESIPYKLTDSQNSAVRQILLDEKSNKPMNRLLLGDVGCGKTIVAFIAMFNVIKNGYQASLMAPTEILASQHYEGAKNLFEHFGINVVLLCGSTKPKEKKLIKERIENGDANMIIGTHSLLENDVIFKNLGMVVTDEQHRFGVVQRSLLINKKNDIDVLVMSATPIPRTLMLYLYDDLDVSKITDLPSERKQIKTVFISEKNMPKAYNFALSEIEKRRQVYIVCPFIEDNDEGIVKSVDKVYSEIKSRYMKNVRIEALHGKMNPKQKEDVISKFKNGDIDVLVSTTVIEVGVNVQNASVMIIENAERFGLAELHQLRGRVGRGSYQGYCILVGNIKNEASKKKMDTMVKNNDGFYIAEEDLKIRGCGELFGLRQHGEDEILLGNFFEDVDLLKSAKGEASNILNSTNITDINFVNEIKKKLQQNSKNICFN